MHTHGRDNISAGCGLRGTRWKNSARKRAVGGWRCARLCGLQGARVPSIFECLGAGRGLVGQQCRAEDNNAVSRLSLWFPR